MYRRADAKVAALAVGVMVMAVAFLRSVGCPLLEGAGIAEGCSLAGRLLHPLAHGGWLHALVNVYVLWQLVFFFPVSLRLLLGSYVVACCCPVVVAVWTVVPPSPGSVVGLSGVDYVLMGWLMPRLSRPLRFNVMVAVWMLAGMATGTVAVGMHLFCYLCGAIAGCRRRL